MKYFLMEYGLLLPSSKEPEFSYVTYKHSERTDFLTRWERNLHLSHIVDLKVFFIDTSASTVMDITNKFHEIKNAI
jgi:uncharacterized protein CbrC (UPF0167 family)